MNTLVKTTINGSSLLEAFEHSVYDYVARGDGGHGGSRNFLQVSGE